MGTIKVVISGAEGLGKTRLAQAFKEVIYDQELEGVVATDIEIWSVNTPVENGGAMHCEAKIIL